MKHQKKLSMEIHSLSQVRFCGSRQWNRVQYAKYLSGLVRNPYLWNGRGESRTDQREKSNWQVHKTLSSHMGSSGGHMHKCVLCCAVLSCSVVYNSVNSWTVTRKAPLFMRILKARILEWVAMPSSRGSSQSRDRIQVSHIAGRFFTIWATREAPGILQWTEKVSYMD